MTSRKLFLASTIAAVAAFTTLATSAQMDSSVGAASMSSTKNIVENAANTPTDTTLVAAIKAAGLVPTLSSKGPYTVFAPTNDAFSKLPDGTVQTLMAPENKDTLIKVLTYHVVHGKIDSSKLMAKIKKGHGTASLTTLQGEQLNVTMPTPGTFLVTDAKGGTASVTTSDVHDSNGVLYGINAVLMPN